MSVAQGHGIWIGGEIRGSTDPWKHAQDIIATMKREGIDWACVQIEPDTFELDLLVRAAAGTRAVGGWSQNIHPEGALERMRLVPGATFFSVNAESKYEEQRWTTPRVLAMQAHCPDGVSLIFQQGAIDYHTPGNAKSPESKAVAKRWIDLGVEAIPEAIQSENPQATIAAMMEMCSDLGWKPEDVAPALYLTKGYPARHYHDQIHLTNGRWSLYRYGDIKEADWGEVATWPKPSTDPQPEPPPEPEPPLSATVADKILELLEAPIEGGGITTLDALDLVEEVVNCWERRQDAEGIPTNERQRLVVARAIVVSLSDQWRAAAPNVVAALKAAGIEVKT